MSYATQYIRFPSGRRLGFTIYGDPKGKPLFYFHGWPASRLSAAIYDELAKKLHIRIIAPDRPGFGVSDFQAGRTLLDWPDDVAAIADFLHIQKFSVMGVSGGAPSAVACAYKIPRRLTSLGIVVGAAPAGDILNGGTIGRVLMRVIRTITASALLRKLSVSVQYLNIRHGFGVDAYRSLWGRADMRLYRDKAIYKRGNDTLREAFRAGIRGPELDLQLISTSFSFPLSAIRVPTHLWYGGDDQLVVVEMGKYYASHIPKSTFTLIPGEGHLISVTHAEDIFRVLVNS